MTRKVVRDQILRTAGWYLGSDEHILGVARVWVTDVSRRMPLFFRQRSFYDLVVTDQRIVLLARPRRFRVPWHRRRTPPDGPLVAKRHADFSIVHLRRAAVLLQVRLRYSGGSDLVLEFRALDRGVAHALVAQIQQASQAQYAT